MTSAGMPLESQYAVVDEMVVHYGDQVIRGALLDLRGLDPDMIEPGTAAEALDTMTAQRADGVLDEMLREFPISDEVA